MSLKSTLIVGLVALGACAGCATGTGSATSGTSTDGAYGQAAPGTSGREVPTCTGGYSYNRAANLCVSPGGA